MPRLLSGALLITTGFAVLATGCGSTIIPPLPPGPANPNPIITWPRPAPITSPAPLTSTQLDATANVPGSFVYSPPAGTVLAPGMQTLSTVFTPTDTDYNQGTASVTQLVNAVGGDPPPTIDANLAVSDQDHGRVLLFLTPLSSGMSPSTVLGQKDFTSSNATEGANLLVGPKGLRMDSAGDLYVADAANCRVARFPPPFTTSMNADLEIGVPAFTSPNGAPYPCLTNTPATSLALPSDASTDADGNLWVADPLSGRVLRFPQPLTNAMAADLTLGNVKNMSDDCNGVDNDVNNPPRGHPPGTPPSASATRLCYPAAATFDRNGDLWVADGGNNRLLEYMPPFSAGMAATLELGYPVSVGMNSPFTGSAFHGDGCASASSASLCSPGALAFDPHGNLWVADTGDRRLLEFSPPFSSGMAATLVIGQPDFTQSAAASAAADTVGTPAGLSFDTNSDLFVSDGQDNRILIYSPPFINGMSAIIVIGQPNMSSGGALHCASAPRAANTLCSPDGVLAY